VIAFLGLLSIANNLNNWINHHDEVIELEIQKTQLSIELLKLELLQIERLKKQNINQAMVKCNEDI
jgi:hypothetical protein